MDMVMGFYEFPESGEQPVAIPRVFPNPESVDGFQTDNLSVVRIPMSDPETYSFKAWSRFRRYDFRITPRQDIDLKLAQLNLPPSEHFLRNHEVILQDELDQHLDYRDPHSYGFVVEMSRAEFVGYYNLLISSPYLHDNYNTFSLTWDWRDLPARSDYDTEPNFLLFHFPEGEYDIGAPLTRTEMYELFCEEYPDAKPDIRLRVIADSDTGECGNLFIAEDKTTEDDLDDGHIRLGRMVSLPPGEFTISNSLEELFMGLVPNPCPEIELPEPEDEENEKDEVLFDYGASLDYNTIFGDPNEQLYLEDLFGPDSEQSDQADESSQSGKPNQPGASSPSS